MLRTIALSLCVSLFFASSAVAESAANKVYRSRSGGSTMTAARTVKSSEVGKKAQTAAENTARAKLSDDADLDSFGKPARKRVYRSRSGGSSMIKIISRS